MSYPVFYVPAGDVLPVLFDTFDGGTGASITMTGLAVTDIEIYKDGSVTQRASDAGYTLLDTDGIDFDGITGIHGFSIDTGDNTDAGFYTVGSWFTVVVSTITVDGQTVSFIACQFRLMPAESVAGKPKVDVDAFGGTAGTFSSGRPEVNTTHIGGTIQTANDVGADVDAILVDTGTTLQGELDGIQADTEDIQSRLPAALVGGRIDATVDGTGLEAAAAAVIADAVWDELQSGHVGAGTFGEIATEIAAILVDTAEIGAAGAGLTEAGGTGDQLTALATAANLATVDTVVDAIKAKTDSLTFGVAGQVDANVQSINDVALTGDGSVTPFDVA